MKVICQHIFQAICIFYDIFVHYVTLKSLTISGMDYETLREELLRGMRLSRPKLATNNISHILQTCWLDDAEARPSFSRIKYLLYKDEKFPKELVENCNGFYHTTKTTMHSQYLSIQKCNPMYESRNNNNVSHKRNGRIAASSTEDITKYSDRQYQNTKGDQGNENDSYKRVKSYFLRRTSESTTCGERTISTSSSQGNYISVDTTTSSCGEDGYLQSNITHLDSYLDMSDK